MVGTNYSLLLLHGDSFVMVSIRSSRFRSNRVHLDPPFRTKIASSSVRWVCRGGCSVSKPCSVTAATVYTPPVVYNNRGRASGARQSAHPATVTCPWGRGQMETDPRRNPQEPRGQRGESRVLSRSARSART